MAILLKLDPVICKEKATGADQRIQFWLNCLYVKKKIYTEEHIL